MKTAVILCTYNRPEYLQECLDSLLRATFHKDTTLIIVDDASSIEQVQTMIRSFSIPGVTTIVIENTTRGGIKQSLLTGYGKAFSMGCEIAMNIDSDALVRNDFMDVLIPLKQRFENNIVTGFNCLTQNRDGSERHKILSDGDGYNMKKTVGGINMVITERIYEKHVKPALLSPGNWDQNACLNANADGGLTVVCSVPSVIQHIGFESSMGHTAAEHPDVADDFKILHLKDVTLIGADCYEVSRLHKAFKKSMRDIIFGDVVLLSSQHVNEKYFYEIPPIKSKEEYSKFIIQKLNSYVQTKFALIVQFDGYVVNPKAWRPSFLKHDYIGATWWYRDGKDVGNGGFSLRSKKLLEICQTDSTITQFHPEDHHICRTYRQYLEKEYNIEFASNVIADQFSAETYGVPNHMYKGSFGFHGQLVDFRGTPQHQLVNE